MSLTDAELAEIDDALAKYGHIYEHTAGPLLAEVRRLREDVRDAVQLYEAERGKRVDVEAERDVWQAEVRRLREEVATLRAIDTSADAFVDALIAAWAADDGTAPTEPMEAARYGLRRHLYRLRAEVERLAGVALQACDVADGLLWSAPRLCRVPK